MREANPFSYSAGPHHPRYIREGVVGRSSVWLWIAVLSPFVLVVATVAVIALAHHAPPAGGGG
jgi:hypothetical protein